MKKIILIAIIFLFCLISVNAKEKKLVNVSNVKYKTYDARGNKQEGQLKFTTTYIYEIEEA